MRVLLLPLFLALAACGSLTRSSSGPTLDADDQAWLADTIAAQLEDRSDLLRSRAWCLFPIILRLNGEVVPTAAICAAIGDEMLDAGVDFYPEPRADTAQVRIEGSVSGPDMAGVQSSSRYDFTIRLIAADGRLLQQFSLRVDKSWTAQPKWRL
ncbi:MAG: hypothetical protein J0M02_12215 [Planctomycetes bacterium]|nr:hypothetical protein [Planctomycetota bacterium]